MLCLKIILAVASLKYLQDSQKEIYTGEVVNGLPDGSGIFYGLDGYKYEGNWKNGKQHGFGKQIFAEHDTNNCSSYERLSYEGFFEIGVRSGNGTLKWEGGEKYEGAENVRSGFGIDYYSYGTKYIGNWENDKEHGDGILYASDGTVIFDGKWKNGNQLI